MLLVLSTIATRLAVCLPDGSIVLIISFCSGIVVWLLAPTTGTIVFLGNTVLTILLIILSVCSSVTWVTSGSNLKLVSVSVTVVVPLILYSVPNSVVFSSINLVTSGWDISICLLPNKANKFNWLMNLK